MDRATSSQLMVGSTDLLRAWTCDNHECGAFGEQGLEPQAWNPLYTWNMPSWPPWNSWTTAVKQMNRVHFLSC